MLRKSSRIYIPKRLYSRLKSIYLNPLTILTAQDGCGKTSVIGEFVKRSRPDGWACRFITKGDNEDECFRRYCRLVLGKDEPIPVTAEDYERLSMIFTAAKPDKPTLIILDCPFAEKMVLSNLYCAKLMAQHSPAKTVVLCREAGRNCAEMLEYCGGSMITEQELCFTPTETAEYIRRSGLSVQYADEIYSRTQGIPMKVELCILARKNALTPTDFDLIPLTRYMITHLLTRQQLCGAIIYACTMKLDSDVLHDLDGCTAVKAYFGESSLQSSTLISSAEALNRILPLVTFNQKEGTHDAHVILKHAMLGHFTTLPEEIRSELHHVVAKEYIKYGMSFRAFLQYAFAKDFYAAAAVTKKEYVSLEILLKCQGYLLAIVQFMPFDCKPIIPKFVRALALLMITPYKEQVKPIYSRLINHLSSSPDYLPKERSNILCYAYAMRTYEDFFLMEKMGNHIKRAYEYYTDVTVPHSPFSSWGIYSPSVFALIHRYSIPLSTESGQLSRYMQMYTEMVHHGIHVFANYSAECSYYTMNFTAGISQALSVAEQCREEDLLSPKLAALNTAARCAIMLGDFSAYQSCKDRIADIMRNTNKSEIADMAGLVLALLCVIKSGSPEEVWRACAKDDSALLLNRYAAPFCFFARLFALMTMKRYNELLQKYEFYFNAAKEVRNETILIMMKFVAAFAFLQIKNEDKCIEMLTETADSLASSGIDMPAVELCIHFPVLFQYGEEKIERHSDFFRRVQQYSIPLRKRMETLRTMELTYISKQNRGAGSALIALELGTVNYSAMMAEYKLTEKAMKYAVLAAKSYSNLEIAEICGTTENSVKSSLKRTFAKLGISARKQLAFVLDIEGAVEE